MKEFKQIVYVGGKKYEIKEPEIYRAYKRARELVKDGCQIIGWRGKNGLLDQSTQQED